MRIRLPRHATGLMPALLCCAKVSAAQNAHLAEKPAQSMIGLAFTSPLQGEPIPGHPTCISTSEMRVFKDGEDLPDRSVTHARCGGRDILMLQVETGKSPNLWPRYLVVDTLLLPRLSRNDWPIPVKAPRLEDMSNCELDGSRDTLFFAVVRWGRRERVTGRTGVLHAWGFDENHRRIVPLDTSRIVCWRPEPD